MTTIPLLSTILRHVTARSLTLEHSDGVTLPAPTAGRTYTLYAHVPFCIQLCPYCAFNRFPFSESEARGVLTLAFASEIVDRVPLEPLRAHLTERVLGWLAGGVPESR